MSLTPRLFAHAQLDELRVELQRQEQLRHMKRARERLEEQREKVGFYRCLRSSHHTEARLLEAYARLPPDAHARACHDTHAHEDTHHDMHVHAHAHVTCACDMCMCMLCAWLHAPYNFARCAWM